VTETRMPPYGPSSTQTVNTRAGQRQNTAGAADLAAFGLCARHARTFASAPNVAARGLQISTRDSESADYGGFGGLAFCG
jgi:hypothetical protein